MRMFYFEKMRVWSDARNLVNSIYKVVQKFPEEEKYLLTDQIKRSANSVRSNITEGQGRRTVKDQLRFTNMSYSSLIETLNHLITALDQEYIDEGEYKEIRSLIESIGRQLHSLRAVQENR